MAFAVSTVIAAASLTVGAAGLYASYEGSQKQASSQAAAAQTQAQIGALQAQNVDVQQQQLQLQTEQQQLQIQAQKDVINQQAQADALRERAAELDAKRRTRDAIRQGIVASSTSLVRATNQGAASPGSTVVNQSQGSIQGQTNTNIAGINQQLDFGRTLYSINKNISQIYLNAQDANSQFVAQSQGLQSQVLNTQKQIYQLGGQVSSDYASAAVGAGQAAVGQSLMGLSTIVGNNYSTINRVSSYISGQFSNTASYFNPGYTASSFGNGST